MRRAITLATVKQAEMRHNVVYDQKPVYSHKKY
jgi:hypothetical protein